MKTTKARARVRLEIEIDVNDVWGDDCTAAQIHRQAIQSAKDRIKLPPGPFPDLRIVGEPVVTAILVDVQ